MRTIIVASKNQGKLKEIRDLLGGLDFKIVSLADYTKLPDIVEDGKTFQENAVKKALTIARHTGNMVIGEDSGLEVQALGGRPGVYSARFSGKDATDRKNNARLLRMLKGIPMAKRQARYHCYVALADGDELVTVMHGSCRGFIALKAKGQNGFGYDPLFFIPRYQKTFGELDPKIKARMSHRARAFRRMKKFLMTYWHLIPG